MGRAAVVEHDRRLRRQPADQEVPHHPTGGREPEEPVAGLGVDVQVELLERLEQDAAVPVHDRLRQTRGAGAVEHPQRLVERDLGEAQVHPLAERLELRPRDRVAEAREVG